VLPTAASPAALQALAPEIRATYLAAIETALQLVFRVAAAIGALAFLLALCLREVPLRGMERTEDLSETFSLPRDATSLEELERIVTALLAHENRWRLYADLATRAQLDLTAPELWMLARLGERAPRSLQSLSEDLKLPPARLEGPLAALRERGIAEPDPQGNLRLTAAGAAMRDRVLAARRQGLADLMARWEPQRHPDVLALLDRMVATLVRDLPAPGQFSGTLPAGAANRPR
jgi:DNA-binding MarR family transcriptional regulator